MGDQAFIAWRRILEVEMPGHTRLVDLHRGMVERGRVSRTQLPGPDEPPFRNRDRNDEVPVNVISAAVEDECAIHTQHQVRRAQLPFFIQRRHWRHRGGIPWWRAPSYPVLNEIDLELGQPSRIHEVAMAGFRPPRRHVPAPGHRRDPFSSTLHVLVGEEAEWGQSLGMMTGDAMLEDDRRDVVCERDGTRLSHRRAWPAEVEGNERQRGDSGGDENAP